MASAAPPPETAPPRPAARRPTNPVPAGACDTHAHVFGPASRYLQAPRRPYSPAPGTGLDAYRRMLQQIGFARAVLVHSNIYGPDNRATLDALAATGGAFRGVALIRPEIDEAALQALAAAGMCGVRINLQFPGELSLDAVEALAPRLAGLGWHLQLLVALAHLPAIATRLAALPIDVVIDHLGLARPAAGPAWPAAGSAWPAAGRPPGLDALLRLLEGGRCWVKLSAPYYGGEAAPWPGAASLARRLFAARPDRLLFGTNWPHPNAGVVPDDGDLVDWLAAITATPAGLAQVLVANPAALYRFAAD